MTTDRGGGAAGLRAAIDGLTLGGSARASVLIDGEAAQGSSFAGVSLIDGDEERGIVIQGIPEDGTVPAGVDAAGKVTKDGGQLFPVAVGPQWVGAAE